MHATEVSESIRNSMHDMLSETQNLIDTLRKEGGERYGAALAAGTAMTVGALVGAVVAIVLPRR